MTIILVAFRDDPGRAVLYKKFTDIEKAVKQYRHLLEWAQMAEEKAKPRVISTRLIVS